MNILRVVTKPESSGIYRVYWTNTNLKPYAQRGVIRVLTRQMADDNIVAEMHALQYLLEVEEVVGLNRAGDQNLQLIVTKGAIKKLARQGSDKRELEGYAQFLTTRFKGSLLKVEKDESWINTAEEPSITLDSSELSEETIEIPAIGDVYVTSHVIEQFAIRFDVKSFGEAWRKLLKIAADDRLKEMVRSSERMKIKYEMQGKVLGRYFHHPTQNAMLIVVHDSQRNKPVLVTAYRSISPAE